MNKHTAEARNRRSEDFRALRKCDKFVGIPRGEYFIPLDKAAGMAKYATRRMFKDRRKEKTLCAASATL